MRERPMTFAAGVLVGAMLFGGGAAIAAGLLAEPSTQSFYLDDKPITLEAYAINGHNYVKLRDVGQAVGFNVAYDPDRNAAIIQPDDPYTGTDVTAPRPGEAAKPDAQPNPAVFTAELTREVYDGLRDTLTHREAVAAGTYQPGIVGSVVRYGQVDDAVARLGRYPTYELQAAPSGGYVCVAKHPPAYAAASSHTQPFIDSLAGLGDEEKINRIAWYVADHLTYSLDIVSPAKVLATDDVTAGNCMSYAYSFQFLCNKAGIPCTLVESEAHQWNKVYALGKWWDVDVTSTDVGNGTSHREYSTALIPPQEMQGADFQDAAPAVTAFVLELLVPGSTG